MGRGEFFLGEFGDLVGEGDIRDAVAHENKGGVGKDGVFGDFGCVGEDGGFGGGGYVMVAENAADGDAAAAIGSVDVAVEEGSSTFFNGAEVAGIGWFCVFGELDGFVGCAEDGAAVSDVGGPDVAVDDEGNDGG